MKHPLNSANGDFRTQAFAEHKSSEHEFRTHTPGEQSRNGRLAEHVAALSTLHNLVLAEVFCAQPETLTVTELFQRTHGQFTASGLLDFTRAVVRLEEDGLLAPVSPRAPGEGRAGNDGTRRVEPLTKQVAAEGGWAPLAIGGSASQPRDGADLTSCGAPQQRRERCIKSAITPKGELYLFSQLLLGLLPDEALGKLAKSGIADGPAPLVEPTSGPAVDHTLRHAPAESEGNSGDAAPKLTSPLSAYFLAGNGKLTPHGDTSAPAPETARADTQSESANLSTEYLPSLMEQLFPEIFGTATRLEDVCHCGELAHRTCPCGARTCHNHFYDGEGNLARRDHAGFCTECVDLIREEAAGIARYGRTQ
jgi:hypothetical protein